MSFLSIFDDDLKFIMKFKVYEEKIIQEYWRLWNLHPKPNLNDLLLSITFMIGYEDLILVLVIYI